MRGKMWVAGGALAAVLVIGGVMLLARPPSPSGAQSAAQAGDDEEGASGVGTSRPTVGDPVATRAAEVARHYEEAAAQARAAAPAGEAAQAPSGAAPTGVRKLAPVPMRPPIGGEPTLSLSTGRPAPSRSDDDRSPALKRIIEVTQPTPDQLPRIRELWETHEDERRALYAAPPKSAAPPEVTVAGEMPQVDSRFERALITTVLKGPQIERLHDALHPNLGLPLN